MSETGEWSGGQKGSVTVELVTAPAGCAKCAQCEELVARLQSAQPGRIDFRKIPADDPRAEQFGVVMPPMLIVDGTIVSAGRVPKEERLGRFIAERL